MHTGKSYVMGRTCKLHNNSAGGEDQIPISVVVRKEERFCVTMLLFVGTTHSRISPAFFNNSSYSFLLGTWFPGHSDKLFVSSSRKAESKYLFICLAILWLPLEFPLFLIVGELHMGSLIFFSVLAKA